MRTACTVVAVLLLLAATLAAPALAYKTTIMVVRSQSVLAPAVTMTPLGAFKGTISIFNIAVAEPGNGVVYISTRPRTEVDFQATSRIAAIIAAIFAGKNFNKYNYYVSVKANTSIIGGPSAGGLTATTFMALLLKLNMTNTTSMTGLICPDGTIGPVGGVASKLEAAARAGIKTFIIPRGEVIVTEPRLINQTYWAGNGTVVTKVIVKEVRFNLTKLAEKLHVRLLQAGSIIDTLYYFTGYNITRTINMTRVIDAIRSASMYWRGPAEKLIKRADKILGIVNNTAINITNTDVKTALENATREAEELLSAARSLMRLGKYYSAASDAFRAWIDALYANAIIQMAEYHSRGADYKHAAVRAAENLLENATRVMEQAYREYKMIGNKTCINLVELQILSSIYERLDEANTTIANMRHVVDRLLAAPGVPAPTPLLLKLLSVSAYALARAHSALDWLSVASSVGGSGYCIPVSAIKEELYTLNQFASDLVSYMFWLGNPSAGAMPAMLTSNTYLLQRAKTAYQVAEAVSRIVNTLSNVMVGIHQMYNTTEIQLPDIALNTRYLLARLVDDNVSAIVPAIYIELAGNLQRPEDKLALYEQAAAYSLLLYVLGTKFTGHQSKASLAVPATTLTPSHLLRLGVQSIYAAVMVAIVAAAVISPQIFSRRRG